MNSGIRRVGAVMMVLFVGLIAQLTYLQIARSTNLADDPRNARGFLRNAQRDRGPIVTADGAIVARSIPADDEYKHQRVYPADSAQLFAHVVGYQSILFGEAGVEKTYSNELAGRTFKLQTSNLADVFARRQPVGTVVLTLSKLVQQVAANALGGKLGSVVALDIQTGGVIAAYSNPTYDPNLFTSHDAKKVAAVRKFILADPRQPLLPHSWAEIYPPGSTFKTVTASITLQNNVDVDKVFPVVSAIPLPQTDPQQFLRNFGGEQCGGTLRDSFIVSCNTTYAQVGFDLGNTFASDIRRFGVQSDPPNQRGSGFDPPIARSSTPDGPVPGTFRFNQPAFMQDAIGQHGIGVTPMQMALVAEAVATGGVILDPHVVNCVKDPDDRVVQRVNTTEYKRAMDPATAATMTDFMLGVVNDPRGTGTAAQIPGVQVAGKTGTAENAPGQNPHAWFIAFAPADHPRFAVSVIVEHGGVDGANAEATGGRVAAPIAKQVLQALLTTSPTDTQCGNTQPSNSTNGG
jgi:peptidoglycan glycosyltransferase